MAEIIIHASEQPAEIECRRYGVVELVRLSLVQTKDRLLSGWGCAIKVDGWRERWELVVDCAGHVRAQCPTAPKVVPRVVEEVR
jgi:hypothetical protein